MLGVPTERYKRHDVRAQCRAHRHVRHHLCVLGYITTGSVYRNDFSLNMIVYSLLGGMGTLIGPIIGAFMVVF